MAAGLAPWEDPLLIAATTGDITRLQEELDKGANVNSRDTEHQRTPLSWVAERGHDDAVQLLLGHGADIDSLEPNFCRTPLLEAIANGHEAVARRLIEEGACVDTRDTMGDTPLLLAVREGIAPLEWRCGQTPLSLAVAGGREDIVQLLLKNNAAIDITDDAGRKPLAWAIEQGHNKIAPPEDADENTASPTDEMYLSAYPVADVGSKEARLARAARLVLEEGANPDLRDKAEQTPLMWAAKEGLADMGVEVDSRDEEGTSPLSIAADYGHAEIDSRDGQELTPLMVAASRGHEALVSLLLERGADPNLRDDSDFTPLLHAALDGHAGRGADPDSRDENGQTAISWAAGHGHLAAVELLLARNVSPNDDEYDTTPLSQALDYSFDTEDYSLVKLLIERGAQPFSDVYWDNRPPLELAAANGLEEMVTLFLGVDAESEGAKQEHVRKAICEAVDNGREDLLKLLFEHYSPVDMGAETPLQWARGKCCGSGQAVRLLRPYFPAIEEGEGKD
ncbi:ankyrin repeat-containing domain protein [Ilyonectria sp. MPI-CAGE-AT-0026]|nr:ankyrin repeat-containing domain protein [Ilyonectria sp. MPI-CAGE-AT-0026]